MYLSLDRNLVGGDEVVRSSSFLACCDGGRGYHSAVLHGDHHCDMVWWSRWLELGGAARDVVDVVWWSELGGAARDVVDVVRSAARSVAQRGLRDGLTTARTACFRLAWWLDFMLSGTLACISHVDLLHTRVRCVHTPLMKSSCMHAYMVYAAVNQ